MLASFRFARYTVLTSPNKDETAVHVHGPSLSVPVVLMSRKAKSSRSISLAVMFVCLFNFLLSRPVKIGDDISKLSYL